MATQDTLRARLRTELRDEGTRFTAESSTDGDTTLFDLPVEFIRLEDFELYLDSTLLTVDVDFLFDERLGAVFFGSPPTAGQVLGAQGFHYEHFTDAQLDIFLDTALSQHAHNRLPVLTYDNIPGVEEYLIVLLALIEALWTLATEASQDIDILTPDGVSIPRQERFQQTMTILQARQAEYAQYAQMLNVGLTRIEVFNLRRVSRSTNRLVPIYVPKEFDDRTATPQRIFVPIDPGTL